MEPSTAEGSPLPAWSARASRGTAEVSHGLQGYLLFLLDLGTHLLCLGLLHHLLHHTDVIADVLVYVLHVEEVQSQALHLGLQGCHCGEGGWSALPTRWLRAGGPWDSAQACTFLCGGIGDSCDPGCPELTGIHLPPLHKCWDYRTGTPSLDGDRFFLTFETECLYPRLASNYWSSCLCHFPRARIIGTYYHIYTGDCLCVCVNPHVHLCRN